jgi:hypothetical protein
MNIKLFNISIEIPYGPQGFVPEQKRKNTTGKTAFYKVSLTGN